MSVIIRLQGLSWSASAMDIRTFFSGLTVRQGGVHIVGGPRGDAFIAFSGDEDARQALLRDGAVLCGSPVHLSLSSKAEMHNVISEARATDAVPAPTYSRPSAHGTSRDVHGVDKGYSGGLQYPQENVSRTARDMDPSHHFQTQSFRDADQAAKHGRGQAQGPWMGEQSARDKPQASYSGRPEVPTDHYPPDGRAPAGQFGDRFGRQPHERQQQYPDTTGKHGLSQQRYDDSDRFHFRNEFSDVTANRKEGILPTPMVPEQPGKPRPDAHPVGGVDETVPKYMPSTDDRQSEITWQGDQRFGAYSGHQHGRADDSSMSAGFHSRRAHEPHVHQDFPSGKRGILPTPDVPMQDKDTDEAYTPLKDVDAGKQGRWPGREKEWSAGRDRGEERPASSDRDTRYPSGPRPSEQARGRAQYPGEDSDFRDSSSRSRGRPRDSPSGHGPRDGPRSKGQGHQKDRHGSSEWSGAQRSFEERPADGYQSERHADRWHSRHSEERARLKRKPDVELEREHGKRPLIERSADEGPSGHKNVDWRSSDSRPETAGADGRLFESGHKRRPPERSEGGMFPHTSVDGDRNRRHQEMDPGGSSGSDWQREQRTGFQDADWAGSRMRPDKPSHNRSAVHEDFESQETAYDPSSFPASSEMDSAGRSRGRGRGFRGGRGRPGGRNQGPRGGEEGFRSESFHDPPPYSEGGEDYYPQYRDEEMLHDNRFESREEHGFEGEYGNHYSGNRDFDVRKNGGNERRANERGHRGRGAMDQGHRGGGVTNHRARGTGDRSYRGRGNVEHNERGFEQQSPGGRRGGGRGQHHGGDSRGAVDMGYGQDIETWGQELRLENTPEQSRSTGKGLLGDAPVGLLPAPPNRIVEDSPPVQHSHEDFQRDRGVRGQTEQTERGERGRGRGRAAGPYRDGRGRGRPRRQDWTPDLDNYWHRHDRGQDHSEHRGRERHWDEGGNSNANDLKSAPVSTLSASKKGKFEGQKTNPDSVVTSQSRYVHAKGFPVSYGEEEIRRFFLGCKLAVDGIHVIKNAHGQGTGEANLQFVNEESAKLAVGKSGEKIAGTPVMMTFTSNKAFESKTSAQTQPAGSDQKKNPSSTNSKSNNLIVQIKGLPANIKREDLVNFFSTVKLADTEMPVLIEYDKSQQATGTAYLQVASAKDYSTAIAFNGHQLGSGQLKVSAGRRQDLDLCVQQQKQLQKASSASDSTELKQQNSGKASSQPPMPLMSINVPRPKNSQEMDETGSSSQLQQEEEQEGSDHPGYCVHIQGLPMLVTYNEIRDFFDGLSIAPRRGVQIVHDAGGKRTGEAFVEVTSQQDKDQALKKDKTSIGRHIVAVKSVTKADMIKRLRNARLAGGPPEPEAGSPSLHSNVPLKRFPPGLLNPHWCYLSCHNFPRRITVQDVLDFFHDYGPIPESVRVHRAPDGSVTGKAVVGFRRKKDAVQALEEMNGQQFGQRTIKLQPAM